MEEKSIGKRSIGVTLWAYFAIASGTWGVIEWTGMFLRPAEPFSKIAIAAAIFVSTGYMGSGILLLRLDELGRKLIILFGIAGLLMLPIYLAPVGKMREEALPPDKMAVYIDGHHELQKKMILDMQGLTEEQRTKMLFDLEANRVKMRESFPKTFDTIMMGIIATPTILLTLASIAYFTRRRVIEQFR